MKKGITPEAAGRLAAFMKSRVAQQGYNPEDWSPADAVQDILSGPAGQELLRAFSYPLWSMEIDMQKILDSAHGLVGQAFDEKFQKALEEADFAILTAGFPIPDPSVWEGLRQGYSEKFDSVLAEIRQKLYGALDQAASDLASEYQEAALREFQKAAGGQGGVTP